MIDFLDYCTWIKYISGFKCVDCGYNCHDKCQSNVPKNCQKLKAFGDPGLSTPYQQDDDSPDSTANYDTGQSVRNTINRTMWFHVKKS